MASTNQQGKQPEFESAMELVQTTFKQWVIQSIEITYRATSKSESRGQGGTPLAAFLLLSCAIDAIAGFFDGRTSEGGTGAQYKKFIKKYMPQYSDVIMWKELRCALAHNYTTGRGLALTHKNPKVHNVRGLIPDAIVKNFEGVFEDFKSGVDKYFCDLAKSEEMKKNFMKRFRKFGIASRIPLSPQLNVNARTSVRASYATGSK